MRFTLRTYRHVFCGENDSNGKLTGFHHKMKKRVGDEIAYASNFERSSTRYAINFNKSRRLYKANVYRISDHQPKKGQGYSTFFPLTWDRNKVEDCINNVVHIGDRDSNFYYNQENDIVMIKYSEKNSDICKTAYPIFALEGIDDEI